MSFIIDSTTTVSQSLTSVTSVGVITSSGALITQGVGVSVTGGGGFIVNDGLINALSFCINATADFSLMNRGLITTESYAISINIAGVTETTTSITNSGDIASTMSSALFCAEAGITIQNSGLISGRTSTINLTTYDQSVVSHINNSGTIEVQPTANNHYAITCNGALVLWNTGTILGELNLGDGDDIVDNRAGIILGDIMLDDGDNLLRGGTLGEYIAAGVGADTLNGEGGDDSITAGYGDDMLRGGTGDDLLISSSGADTLRGGEGDDTLTGGNEADSLFGGRGEDSFIFLTTGDSDLLQDTDRIEDFQRGADVIDLSALSAVLAFVGTGPLTGGGTASVGYSRTGGNAIVFVDQNGDGAADMHIAVIDIKTLGLADFIL